MLYIEECIVKMKKLAAALAVAFLLAGCGGGSEGIDAQTSIGDETDDISELSEFPLRAGAYVGNPAISSAVVGQLYSYKLGVVAVDSRNDITKLEIRNPTVGGAVPSIDASGVVQWMPNQLDLAQTTVLKLTISLRIGAATQVDMPVVVHSERIAFQTTIGADDASYSDDEGSYVISATRRNAATSMQGKLVVTEYYNSAGLARWTVTTEDSNETVTLKVLSAPTVVPPTPPGTLTTQADFPLRQIDLSAVEFKSLTLFGSMLADGVNVFSVRSAPATGYGYNHGNKSSSSVGHQVLNFYSSCSSQQACVNAAKGRAPVLLIHGFSGGDSLGTNNAMKGGGVYTWGGLPQLLIDKGHPVFEMQWHSYMRFEEAAGALAKFSFAVARYTGMKPIIVAHSFGGVVSHLALESEGIEHDGAEWVPVKYRDQISRLITLNSPLSGINHPSGMLDRSNFVPGKVSSVDGRVFQTTRGRDHSDKLIGECYSVTCLQAGALFPPESFSGNALRLQSALVAGYGDEMVYEPVGPIGQQRMQFTSGKSRTPWEGESIKRLQDNASKINIPVLRFAGFQNLHESSRNKLHGDGLISLVGQALFPAHFAADPFNTNADFDYKFISGSDNLQMYHSGKTAALENKPFSKLEAGDCFQYKVDVFPYIICARSAHTGDDQNRPYSVSGKRVMGQGPAALDFSIANYGNEDPGVRHPMLTLVEDEKWLKTEPEPFNLADACAMQPMPLVCVQSTSTYKGKAIYGTANSLSLMSDNPVKAVVTSMHLTHKTTGVMRSDFQGFYTDENGQFEIDVSAALAARVSADAKLEDYRLTLGIKVVGYEPYAAAFEDIESGTVDLGTITLKPLGDKVSFSGKVIDGQTVSTGIGVATVRMAQGRDLDANTIIQRSDVVNSSSVLTARKLTTDASGNFSVVNLRAGEYSVLVTKAGYSDQLQGRVTIAANSTLSMSLLRVATQGDSSITLRWAADGSGVARDLDSHLLRLDSAGAVNYHIYYSNTNNSVSTDSLDRDDVDFEGPETITFNTTAAFNYSYYVHRFSDGGTIPESQARVTLRYAGRTLTYLPPANGATTAEYWRVFDVVDGVVKRCQTNCYFDMAPIGLMTQSVAQLLPEQHRSALSTLPAKR